MTAIPQKASPGQGGAPPARDFTEINRALAQRWRERRDALGYRGKKADDAALDFIIGAAAGAQFAGDIALAEHVNRVALLIVRVRGSIGLAMLGEDRPAPDAPFP